MDVLGAANFVRTQTLRTYEPLLVTALVYLVLALLIEEVFRRLAHRLPTRSGF
jgi:polar amino acid transport system permease protein